MYDFSKLINRYDTNSLKWDIDKQELPMWVADMDFEAAPCIIEALQQRVNHGVFGYNVVPNDYYESIQNWWRDNHDFTFETSWMMFCTGVVPAISSIIRKLTTVGENILIQSPVYNIFYNSIINNGRNVLSSDLNYNGKEYSIDFKDLEVKLSMPQTTMMILCNPHNPIGMVWDYETLKKIGDLCYKHHVIVISDEIHCDIINPDYKYIPFASVSNTNLMNSITCVAPTKAFNLAGLQSACIIVANENLRHKVNRGINTDEVAEPNSFVITATISAFENGRQWLNELNLYIQNNKQFAIDYMNKNLLELYVVKSKATYLLWIDCTFLCTDSKKLVNWIRKQTGLYLSSGEDYGDNGKTFIRMNIACPQERLEDGLNRLKSGIDSYLNKEIIDEKLLQRMQQYEDIINMGFLYQKNTKEIMMQYIYQKRLMVNEKMSESQDFILSQNDMKILETLIGNNK